MKDMLLNKLSAVTFEPWEADPTAPKTPGSRSRRSSVSLKSESLGSPNRVVHVKTQADVHVTPTVTKPKQPSVSQNLSSEVAFSETDNVNTASLMHRYQKVDLSFEDTILDETEISEERLPTSMDLSQQAEVAATALIENIKRSSSARRSPS